MAMTTTTSYKGILGTLGTLGDMGDMSTMCIGCNSCLSLKRGAKPKILPVCHQTLPESEMQPTGYSFNNRFFSKYFRLFEILKRTMNRRSWSKHRRKLGYHPETHVRIRRPKLAPAPKVNWDFSNSAWNLTRRDIRDTFADEPLEYIVSTPPRIAVAEKFGPNVLARTFFPNIMEVPKVTLTSEDAERLEQERVERKLSGRGGLCLGGLQNSIDSLEKFAKKINTDVEFEDEPLRTMAIKEVTLIKK